MENTTNNNVTTEELVTANVAKKASWGKTFMTEHPIGGMALAATAATAASMVVGVVLEAGAKLIGAAFQKGKDRRAAKRAKKAKVVEGTATDVKENA